MGRILIETAKLKNPDSGLGQFCFHLGRELLRQKPDNLDFNFYLPPGRKGIFGETGYVMQSDFHKYFPKNSSKYGLWHCLHQESPYLPSQKSTPLLFTICDLNFLRRYSGRKLQKKIDILQRKIDCATALTTISRFVAEDVAKNLNTGNKPVHVVHLGNCLDHSITALKPECAPDCKFIFSIGIIQRKKNFHVLIPFLKTLDSTKLVIAGNKSDPYFNEVLDIAARSGLSDKVYFPGTVSDAEKLWYYQNCQAFVFPSLTEGFGLPVIEAMSQGKPVFLYRGSSLPEVGGEEAFYWDGFDPDQMREIFTNGLKVYETDPEKKQRIMKWAGKFSWANAAARYIELYNAYSS